MKIFSPLGFFLLCTSVLSGHPNNFPENFSFLHFFRVGMMFELMLLDYTCFGLSSWALLLILLSGECHRTPLMIIEWVDRWVIDWEMNHWKLAISGMFCCVWKPSCQCNHNCSGLLSPSFPTEKRESAMELPQSVCPFVCVSRHLFIHLATCNTIT